MSMKSKEKGKQLGFFIIKENENTDLNEEYRNLTKHYKQRFDIYSSNHPHHTYFTHIYIEKLRLGEWYNSGRIICMYLYSEYGYRYNKEDVDHMLKIIEKFIGRDIDFFMTEKETATFYKTTPITFDEKKFHVEDTTQEA